MRTTQCQTTSQVQSLNRYAYVMNNPTTLTDPLGLCSPSDPNCHEPCQIGSCREPGVFPRPAGGLGGRCSGFLLGGCHSGYPWNVSQEILAGEAQYVVNNNLCGPGGCGGVSYTQGGLTYTWVPGTFSQSGDVIQISTGYWASIISAPDFISLNINIGLPWLANLVGPTFAFAFNRARNGNLYFGPGINVGKGATQVSVSLTGDWLNQRNAPTQDQLNRFLTSNSFNVTAGYWAGLQFGWTPGSGTSSGAGFDTPQAGLAWTYSWKLFNVGAGW
jgi:hypothetical protein